MSKKAGFIPVLLCGLWLALSASGCTRVTFKDSVDLTLDFSPLLGPSDLLHTPYVEGSSMWIYAESSSDNERYVDWHISSSDPSVFLIENQQLHKRYVFARGKALRPGQATLVVTDGGGSVVGTDVVDVQRPDEVRLLAHGLLLIDRSDEEAQARDLRVVAGGTGTYLARYYRGGQPLFGNGALGAATDAGATATVAQSFLFEDRDWLQVSSADAGVHSVTLNINGSPLSSVLLQGVAPSDVTGIRILGQDESRAKKDQPMVALALASDRSGQAVYGVEYTWQLGSKMQLGLGDLFRYLFDPSRPQMLTAQAAAPTAPMTAQAMIHASQGYVSSSNRIGCSAVPGAGIPLSPWLTLLSAAPVVAILRRRRRQAAQPDERSPQAR